MGGSNQKAALLPLEFSTPPCTDGGSNIIGNSIFIGYSMQARHLPEKLMISERILDVEGAALVAAIFKTGGGGKNSDDEAKIRKYTQRFYKWRRGESSTDDKDFFDNLAAELEYHETIGHMMACSPNEFYLAIPEAKRKALSPRELSSLLAQTSGLPKIKLDPHINYDHLLKALEKSYADGKLDQKFLYLDAESVRRWKRLTTGRKYETYEDCLSALELFLGAGYWVQLIDKGEIDAVVDLGVGSGQKDQNIIESILLRSTPGSLKFSGIDTSFYMLEATLDELRFLEKENVGRLSAHGFRADFMDLRTIAKDLRAERRTAFFILGNTFANVQETQFMLSMQKTMEHGDLLVIGAEFSDVGATGETKARTRRQFENEHLYSFAITPIESISHKPSLDETGKVVQIEISEPHAFSDLQKARAVVIRVKAGNRDIIVAHSNRYEEAEFIHFVEHYGFKLREKTPSERNPKYHILAFERVKG